MTKWFARVLVAIALGAALILGFAIIGENVVTIVVIVSCVLVGLLALWVLFAVVAKAVEVGVRRGTDRR